MREGTGLTWFSPASHGLDCASWMNLAHLHPVLTLRVAPGLQSWPVPSSSCFCTKSHTCQSALNKAPAAGPEPARLYGCIPLFGLHPSSHLTPPACWSGCLMNWQKAYTPSSFICYSRILVNNLRRKEHCLQLYEGWPAHWFKYSIGPVLWRFSQQLYYFMWTIKLQRSMSQLVYVWFVADSVHLRSSELQDNRINMLKSQWNSSVRLSCCVHFIYFNLKQDVGAQGPIINFKKWNKQSLSNFIWWEGPSC